MPTAADATSAYLLMTQHYSTERVMRALLVCDRVYMVEGWPLGGIPPLAIKRLIEDGRVVNIGDTLFGAAIKDDPDRTQRWASYFVDRIVAAYRAGSAALDGWEPASEGGAATRELLDNGLGMVPPPLWGDYRAFRAEEPFCVWAETDVGMPVSLPGRHRNTEPSPPWGQPWGQVDGPFRTLAALLPLREGTEPVRISSRLPEAVAKAAINTAWTRAAEITVTQHAMQVLSDALRGYARIGLIGASRRQVQWVSGLLRDLTEYDCQDDPTVSAVIGMTTSRPSPPFRLSDIPIDRFIDLCDALTEARRCFGEEVVRWSSVIAALGTPTERREKLRQIRRDEIAPSMRQFSSDARADLKSILGDISGTQWASLALGGIAAAICMHYQVAPDETIAAAASAAALGAAGNVAKGIWDRKQKRRQTWMAFASALSDEGDRLADLK